MCIRDSGYTSCVMLPYVLAWNESVNRDRQLELVAALGKSDSSASEAFHNLILDLGMPRHLREIGVMEDQFPQLAENCMLDDWTFSNPRKIRGSKQVMEILESAS